MKEKICYIWLQQAIGLYSRLATEILPRFNGITEIYECEDFSFLGEKREKYIKQLECKDVSEAYEVFKRCERLGVEVVGFYDGLYPKKLRKIEAPPVVLYAIGEFRDLNGLYCVAMVGTRSMTDSGKENAERLAYGFSRCGACVVSGLAKGIDTASHRGAVKAGGYTVAVLGNPIGDIYPKENKTAFETLYKRGLVISELYPGAPRTRSDFPNRNRIISGISDAVIVVEAGAESGALITAKYAKAQGRLLFAVPGAVCEETVGSNALLKRGAIAVTEPNDVLSRTLLANPERLATYRPSATEALDSYGIVKHVAADEITEPPEDQARSETESTEIESGEAIAVEENSEAEVPEEVGLSEASLSERILAELKGPNPITADEIAAKTGIPVSEVLAELTYMEIDGSIISSAGGRYISSRFHDRTDIHGRKH